MYLKYNGGFKKVRLSYGDKKQSPCNARALEGVDFTDKISNQLLKDIEVLSSLKRYISSH